MILIAKKLPKLFGHFSVPKDITPKLVTSCAKWTPGGIWWIHKSHTVQIPPSLNCFIASVSRLVTSVHKTQMRAWKAVGCPESRKLCRCEKFCLRHEAFGAHFTTFTKSTTRLEVHSNLTWKGSVRGWSTWQAIEIDVRRHGFFQNSCFPNWK